MHPRSDAEPDESPGQLPPHEDWEGVCLGSVTSAHDLIKWPTREEITEKIQLSHWPASYGPTDYQGLEIRVRTRVTVDTKCLFHSPRSPLLREQSCKIKIAWQWSCYREDLFRRAADLPWNLYEWETKLCRINPLRFRDLTILQHRPSYPD